MEREREALKHAGLDDNATQLRDPTVNEVERGTLSQYDNQSVKLVGEVIVNIFPSVPLNQSLLKILVICMIEESLEFSTEKVN